MSSAFRPFSLAETLHINEVLTQRLAEEKACALGDVDAKPSTPRWFGKYPHSSMLDIADVNSADFAEQKATSATSRWKAALLHVRKLFEPHHQLKTDKSVSGLSEENLRIINRVTFSLNDLKAAAELAQENLDSGN